MKHDEMIKILQEMIDSLEIDLGYATGQEADVIKDEIFALKKAITLLEAQRWRKPSDELPKSGEYVQAVDDTGQPNTFQFLDFGFGGETDFVWCATGDITLDSKEIKKWRPLEREEESE